MAIEQKIILMEATTNDVDTYLVLEKKVSSKTYAALSSKKEFLEELQRGKIYFFKIDKQTIGHATCEIKNDGSVHLGGVAIDPEWQGRGFGRQAMKLILEIAKDAPKIDLVTHPDNFKAIKLYESLGFKIGPRIENYFGDGQLRVVMAREGRLTSARR